MAKNYTDIYASLIYTADDAFKKIGWSHNLMEQKIDFEETKGDKFNVGCSTVIKIGLKDGRQHSDFGYYESNEKTRGEALFRARMISTINAFRKILWYFEESRNILKERYSRKYIFETNCTEEQRQEQKDALQRDEELLEKSQGMTVDKRELEEEMKRQRLTLAAEKRKKFKIDDAARMKQENNDKEGRNE
ncbi:DNA repair and recombination protein rti1-like, partial [Diachasma alloeum]